jgi:hypothetical protein
MTVRTRWSFRRSGLARCRCSPTSPRTRLLPRPDFIIAQDLYNEIDNVSARITELEKAIIVRGVYNAAMPAVGRLLNEGMNNQLLPVEEWPAVQEKGGLEGNINWMPLEQIVKALEVLRDYRKELIMLEQQVTGMSDIMRGEATQGNATATEQAIKAKFASSAFRTSKKSLPASPATRSPSVQRSS